MAVLLLVEAECLGRNALESPFAEVLGACARLPKATEGKRSKFLIKGEIREKAASLKKVAASLGQPKCSVGGNLRPRVQ